MYNHYDNCRNVAVEIVPVHGKYILINRTVVINIQVFAMHGIVRSLKSSWSSLMTTTLQVHVCAK